MKNPIRIQFNDPWLLALFLGLLGFGLVMIACASIAIAEKQTGVWFYYLERQVLFSIAGLMICYATSKISLDWLERNAKIFLIINFLALILVLIPGIGRNVNGSTRWITIAGFGLQISEFTKIMVVVYLAAYVVRFSEAIQTDLKAFLRPFFVLSLIAGLLLLEPDFGSVVVIFMTGLALLFLAGVPLWQFLMLALVIAASLVGLAVTSPYRWQRLTSFMNPWDDQFSSGYQLTQALIAFGRGEWFGEGIGRGVQKLFYLPEAHTDFIFAVIGEELGLIGAISVLALYMLLVWRGFWLASMALKVENYFAAYLAYGISLLFGMQALISIGVNVGMLPTKGLTLPFISYGGSSLIACMIALGLLLRVSSEISRGATRK
jgi:cell division protein FtsW